MIAYIERDYILNNAILKLWVSVEFFSRIIENIYFYGYAPQLIKRVVGKRQFLIRESVNYWTQKKLKQSMAINKDSFHDEPDEFMLRQEKFDKLCEKIKKKDTVNLDHSFNSMVVLSYVKDIKEKFCFTKETQGHFIYNSLLLFTVQITMLSCMLYTIYYNETGEYTRHFSSEFVVILVKFPCAVALHLYLYPEV